MLQKLRRGVARWKDDCDLVGLKMAVVAGLYILACCLEGWVL